MKRAARSLFWKEIREHKMLFIGAIVARLTLLAIAYVFGRRSGPSDFAIFDLMSVTLVSIIVGGICGSSMISSELANSSLQFLTSLPVSRNRIWWIKLAVQLLLCYSTVAASIGLHYYVGVLLFRLPQTAQFLDYYLFIIPATLTILSIAAALSVFTDRILTAFLMSAIVFVMLAAFLLAFIYPLFTGDHGVVNLFVIIAIILTTNLGVSNYIFVHGENLQTTKRFLLLKDICLLDIIPFLIAVLLSFILIVL